MTVHTNVSIARIWLAHGIVLGNETSNKKLVTQKYELAKESVSQHFDTKFSMKGFHLEIVICVHCLKVLHVTKRIQVGCMWAVGCQFDMPVL